MVYTNLLKHITTDTQGNNTKFCIKCDDLKAEFEHVLLQKLKQKKPFLCISWKTLNLIVESSQTKLPYLCLVKRTKFSLLLEWPFIFQVWGLCLRKVLSFQLLKQRNFGYGQTYVAFWRAKSLEGLYNLDLFQ